VIVIGNLGEAAGKADQSGSNDQRSAKAKQAVENVKDGGIVRSYHPSPTNGPHRRLFLIPTREYTVYLADGATLTPPNEEISCSSRSVPGFALPPGWEWRP